MRRLLALLLLLPLLALAEESSLQVIAYHDVRDDVTGDYDPDQYAVSTRRSLHITMSATTSPATTIRISTRCPRGI
jgi:hypothetical protein